MTYQYKFEKILTVREKEKQDAYSKYTESLKKFEEVAGNLYEFLRRKEEMQAFQQLKMNEGLSVFEIRHHQRFMDNLEEMISHYQKEVIIARNHMNKFQNILIEKNVEVKKYAKIREKDYDRFLDEVKMYENAQMDDISIQTYLSKDN